MDNGPLPVGQVVNQPIVASLGGSHVCVFGGVATGIVLAHAQLAREFGQALADGGATLVCGGGSVGLLGEVQRGAICARGRVVGIVPEFLYEKQGRCVADAVEVSRVTAGDHASQLRERLRLMVAMSDAFVALPGGDGTMEEIATVRTLQKLSIDNAQHKPMVFFDVGHYWKGLIEQLVRAVDHGLAMASPISASTIEGVLREVARGIARRHEATHDAEIGGVVADGPASHSTM